ncbi:MAG TPA: histidine phosphatase family protein, partial [Saprospiraceae bacterium]|nr:histidine phosphatase family protein [Saprospiraceae bacterium]
QEDASLFDERKMAYLKFYEETTLAWAKGELHSELQNWAEYVDQVVSGLETIYQQSKNQNVLIVTSGGPVSIATGLVRKLSISDIIKLTWEVYNASHTKINFQSKPSLEYYNNIAHFDEDKFITLV